MDAYEALIPLTAVLSIFVGMPWIVLHYTTRWKQAKSITLEDENLLDELHEIARRLDERMTTIERIIAADRADLGLSPSAAGNGGATSSSEAQPLRRNLR